MLFVDIETVPLESSLALPYPEAERTPPSNYKAADAIAGWRERDRAAWDTERIKAYSLNPRLGRIVVIGMGNQYNPCWANSAPTEGAEAAVLEGFWERVEEHRGEVGSWNGMWDLRFLVIRSLARGIVPTVPVAPWFRRYQTHPHFDCRAVLTNWEPYRAGEGLDEWAAFFGLEAKTHHGSDVYGLYQAGKLGEIADYCRHDVELTRAIYQRIAPVFRAR